MRRQAGMHNLNILPMRIASSIIKIFPRIWFDNGPSPRHRFSQPGSGHDDSIRPGQRLEVHAILLPLQQIVGDVFRHFRGQVVTIRVVEMLHRHLLQECHRILFHVNIPDVGHQRRIILINIQIQVSRHIQSELLMSDFSCEI